MNTSPDNFTAVENRPLPFFDFLISRWRPGNRHELALALAAHLFQAGSPLAEARGVLMEVLTRTHDEEVEDRLRVLETTYKRGAAGQPLGPSLLKLLGLSREQAFLMLIAELTPSLRVRLFRLVHGDFCTGRSCPEFRKCSWRRARKGALR